MPVLQAIDLYKSYPEAEGNLDVLRGVNLTLNKGETVAITGESGCGKSTLMHLLGLIDIPNKGQILYNGQPAPTSDKQAAMFRAKNLGFVFQFHYLLNDFTVLDNIALPCMLAGGNMAQGRKEAHNLLQMLELDHKANSYPAKLSGGEQQRVAIARALVNKPQLVLADEPTGNLDPRHSQQVVDLILRLNKQTGQTFLLVTHNPEVAAAMQRNLVLQQGQAKGA